jgi:hypothetical protein
MDAFALIVLGAIVLIVLAFLAIGFWHPARAMEITDGDRQRRWATQAEIEEHDIGEMVDSQNDYRRARGEREITGGDVQEIANERQRQSIARSRGHGADED